MQEYTKKIIGSSKHRLDSASHNNTILIISNDEMKHIKIVKSLQDSGLLLKRVSETVQNKAREQKGGFLIMLLGTLGPSLLENILAGRGINRGGEGVIRVGYGIKRQDYKNKIDC